MRPVYQMEEHWPSREHGLLQKVMQKETVAPGLSR
jgi:hypothetical protein